MKLVKQTTLYFCEGNSDKVYEVDLCEVDGKYLVNFRYGRRGSTLRDGTKTTQPVPKDQADKIFDELVQSKTKKGYTEAENVSVAEATDAEPASDSVRQDDVEPHSSRDLGPRERATLERLAGGLKVKSNWKLSRAVWRAGEIGLVEAEPLLHGLVGLDAMTNYSIAWTMGRLGLSNSAVVLRDLAKDTATPHVSQIATEALRLVLPEAERDELITNAIRSLPAPLNEFLKSNSGNAFEKAFLEGLGKNYSADLINVLYFIDNEIARTTLISVLEQTPLEPPFFRAIRRIFKAAEMRRDGQVFGLLAYRFEKHRCRFRVPTYTWRGYKKPTLGESPSQAFGVQTRDYFRRRIWNTLNRLGQLEDPDFVSMAVGTLLPYSDGDAKPFREAERYDYNSRSWQSIRWDAFGDYWAFNQLLYQHSPRYEPLRGKKSFRVTDGHEPGASPPEGREEAFPELWRQHPRALLHLLTESQCHPVHQFAVKSIRGCVEFLDQLPLEVVQLLLQTPYEETLTLGLEMAVKRYDASAPNFALVLALINCRLGAARQQAKAWVDANRNSFFADNDFVFAVLTSPFADSRAIGLNSLYAVPSKREHVEIAAGRLIAFLQSVTLDQAEIAADVGRALLSSTFRKPVSTLGEKVILDLLSSDIIEVQVFAGAVVLEHDTLAKSPTEAVLRAMLDATHPPVRAMGIKVISELPDRVLSENVAMLAGLACHPQPDIRELIRPVVQRLLKRDSRFAKTMASELIRRLLTPGAAEGVPSHTSLVLRMDFGDALGHVSSETVFQLLKSRSAPAQEVGGFLLPTNVNSRNVSVADMVRLANHSIVLVRVAAQKMFSDNRSRVESDLATAVRILDSDWEDSRQFAFSFFKNELNPCLLTPEVMISICDSVREDVQQFGREMITKNFDINDGPEYLVKLSEHPATSLQLFASNFLVEYGSNHPGRMEQLAPYFVSILSRVNQSRIAKDRVLEFLKVEGCKSIAAAKTASQILDRISATCAIGDRATTIEVMLEVHEAFPEIELPITIKPHEVR